MKRAKPKFISLLLIAVLLVNILPASAGAVSQPDTQAATEVQLPTVQTVPNPNYVEPGSVRELESRREENVKHFLLPDNTVQAVVYADAVHRKDADGKWQNISNNLTLTEYKGAKFYTTADERMVFAEKFAPNAQLWQLTENGYSITMGMTQLQLSADATVAPVGGVTVTNAPQRRSAATWHSVEEARVVDNTASIVYSNIKSNTDLEYVMMGNDIKENIVVKSRSSSYSYSFQITLTGLDATLETNGSISLTDSVTGQQQYSIPAPYMVDAAGEYSDSVTYALTQTGKGEYALTVTADSRWINAANREFPIKIDPSVKTNTYMDTFIYSGYPDYAFGDSEELWIMQDVYTYIKGATPVLPDGAQLTNASLEIYYYYYENVTTGNIRISAHQVEEAWSDTSLTWNAALQMNNFGIYPTTVSYQNLSGAVGAYVNTPAKAAINITNIANSWLNGTANHGVALKYYNGTNDAVLVKSEEAETQYRPCIVYTYVLPIIADGVYRLQNVGTGLYLDVRDGGYAEGTVVQQNTLAGTTDQRNQLFKITYLDTYDSNNYYSVRPMTNSAMSLSTATLGGSKPVSLGYIGPNETMNHSHMERMWIIEQNGTNYTLKNGDSSQGGYLTCMSAPAGTQVRTALNVIDNGKWNLVPYTGPVLQGAFITNPVNEMVVGTTFNFDAVVFSSVIGVNGPAEFSVTGVDNASTNKATIVSTTGSGSVGVPGVVFIELAFTGIDVKYKYPLSIKTNTCKTVVLDMKYDHAYLLRYPDAVDRIRSHFYALRDLYIYEFDIWVVMTGPTVFSCYACSSCPTLSSPLGSCACIEGNSMCHDTYLEDNTWHSQKWHHTNLTNILYYHQGKPNTNVNLLMCFIGHECCQKNTNKGVAHQEAPYGIAYEEWGLMYICVTESDPDIDSIERLSVVHEFGHMYGIDDHYGDGCLSTDALKALYPNRPYSKNCIYGERRIEVMNELTICDYCRSVITGNSNKYAHG